MKRTLCCLMVWVVAGSQTLAGADEHQGRPTFPALPGRRLSVKENIRKNLPATVTIHMESDEKYIGSGAVLSRDGLAVTCYHVIENIRRGSVRFPDATTQPVLKILAVDPVNDIALFQIAGSGFSPVRTSERMEIGDDVVVVGSPASLEATVSTGIISSLRNDKKLIQFTAAISPGSSGGPLFNAFGEMIGIAKGSYDGSQNLNFAVPVSEIRKLLASVPPQPNAISRAEESLAQSFEEAMKRFLLRHETDENARMAVAAFCLKKGHADRVLELVEEDAGEQGIYLRAKAYFLKNDIRQAAGLFKQLPEAYYRKEPRLYLYLAALDLENKDLSAAKKDLEKYNTFSDTKDALYYYTVGDLAAAYGLTESRLLEQDQYFEKATGFYKTAEKLNPQFVSATYKRAMVELAMGNLKAAQAICLQLKKKDAALGKQLEQSIVAYGAAVKQTRRNYIRETSKEQLFDTLSLLVYGILAGMGEGGY